MITKEEFLEGIKDMVDDYADPSGHINEIIEELRTMTVDVKPYDAKLSSMFTDLADRFEDMGRYVRNRLEADTGRSDGSKGEEQGT